MPIWLFLALSMAAFASSVTLRIADSLLPEIAREFATTPGAAATAVITTFTVAYGGIQVAFGPIGDRFGKVQTIAVASLLSVAAQVACALSATLDQISIARVVAGATAGGVIPLCLAWIGDVVSFEDRQKVLARFLLAQIVGLAAGQALGGVIGDAFGWRASFLMLAGLYFLGGVAPFVALRATPAAARSGAVTRGNRVRVAEALSRPRVRLILSTVFLEGAAMYGAFSYVGTDLQHRFGVSVSTSGMLLTAFAAGAMGYALFVGRIVAVMSRARIALSGALALGAGFVVLALIPSLAAALIALAFTGFGFYMLHNSLQTEATQMVPEARGTALAMFASMLFVGQAVGVAIAGPFFDHAGAPPLYLVAAAILPLIAARLAYALSRVKS